MGRYPNRFLWRTSTKSYIDRHTDKVGKKREGGKCEVICVNFPSKIQWQCYLLE